ncbi:MAG: hypothetical protein ABL959_16690 [Pyrinomonadaceae bacterium]
MKQCPSCRTTYTDDTLRYCLADGSSLVAHDEEATFVRNSVAEPTVMLGRDLPVRVDIEQAEIATRVVSLPRTNSAVEPQRSSGALFKVLMVVIGLGILAALVVVAGGLIYFNSKNEVSVLKNENGKATATPTPGKDDNEELREQIANLAKKLDEQKKTSNQANVPLKLPGRSTTTTSATVNSPGDGFLALRSLPNSEAGDRIAKIPHGARIAIGACGPVITPVKRSGRWCQATYDGLDGWVFDAYLSY